jgi:hypothetical protein
MNGNQGVERGRNVDALSSTCTKRTFTPYTQKKKNCREGTNAGLPASVSTGQRVIIVHAGSENGLISNALLMLISGTKSGDYQTRNEFW